MRRSMQAFACCCSASSPCGRPGRRPRTARSSRPLRLVVSFPPGGGVDAVARLFADKMSALLGQTVVVENRGGASGIIAGKQVASAEPDGTRVLIASNSMVVAQVMSPNVGLDIARDLKALASAAPQAIIITAQPRSARQHAAGADRARQDPAAQLRLARRGLGSASARRLSVRLAGRRHARAHPVPGRRAGADQSARRADRPRDGHAGAGGDARRRRQDEGHRGDHAGAVGGAAEGRRPPPSPAIRDFR